jgi:hypothetical protein
LAQHGAVVARIAGDQGEPASVEPCGERTTEGLVAHPDAQQSAATQAAARAPADEVDPRPPGVVAAVESSEREIEFGRRAVGVPAARTAAYPAATILPSG